MSFHEHLFEFCQPGGFQRQADTLQQVVDKAVDPKVDETVREFPSDWDITKVNVGQKFYDQGDRPWIVDTVDLDNQSVILIDPLKEREPVAVDLDSLRSFQVAFTSIDEARQSFPAEGDEGPEGLPQGRHIDPYKQVEDFFVPQEKPLGTEMGF